ncbi:TIGR03619 family F420-dependent LLM class oxidoreductase [Amycolatopsis saalfeldensis]|uniref:Probable F420-dependent oxidoreductase, Rv2161c family n=1 Tax=Amycolatopsis saalfeldensis TaxID=394193 RepID=A0A1H8QK47_9PSEU|nr:TIGR03619 family F420-dependent LLM class oxidoreductase [Amycolatopsis saalfeldensis]SEO54610.1 probable F420-dependent oxidoreductase, Rv2161c family [Amycolatopsis saalfeldensis]
MDLQVVLPDEAPDLDPGQFAGLARSAEELGYESVWLPDHVLPPGPFGEVYGGVYEPLVTLAYIAAATERIGLGTSVLILPLREPYVLAKQVATLSRLSGGRLVLGVGVGWNAEEFAEVGVDFSGRGRRTDETLELLERLFTTGRGPSGGHFEPRPAAHVPILVGGNSTVALRRAARAGDAWLSAGLDPTAFAERARTLAVLAEDRPVKPMARMEWSGDRADLDRAVADYHAYEAAGAAAVAVHFGPDGGYEERMRVFAEAVR